MTIDELNSAILQIDRTKQIACNIVSECQALGCNLMKLRDTLQGSTHSLNSKSFDEFMTTDKGKSVLRLITEA